LTGTPCKTAYQDFGRNADADYGGMFYGWLMADEPRLTTVGATGPRCGSRPWALRSGIDEVLREAERSAAVTHNHVEGIKGRRRLRWLSSWRDPAHRRMRSERI
jgi:hypothetical protein